MNDQISTSFKVVPLPRLRADTDNAADLALAEKYREVRLLALRTNPAAFASTYEVEVQRGLEHTLQRLSNPKATGFIAVQDDSNGLLSTTWLGCMTLIGPQDDTSLAFSARMNPLENSTATASGSAANDAALLHFSLHGVFVRPEFRGAGLGRMLMTAALDEAKNICHISSRVRLICDVAVDTENAAARALYERAGFVKIGLEAYTQQPREVAPGVLQSSERLANCLKLEVDILNAL